MPLFHAQNALISTCARNADDLLDQNILAKRKFWTSNEELQSDLLNLLPQWFRIFFVISPQLVGLSFSTSGTSIFSHTTLQHCYSIATAPVTEQLHV